MRRRNRPLKIGINGWIGDTSCKRYKLEEAQELDTGAECADDYPLNR